MGVFSKCLCRPQRISGTGSQCPTLIICCPTSVGRACQERHQVRISSNPTWSSSVIVYSLMFKERFLAELLLQEKKRKFLPLIVCVGHSSPQFSVRGGGLFWGHGCGNCASFWRQWFVNFLLNSLLAFRALDVVLSENPYNPPLIFSWVWCWTYQCSSNRHGMWFHEWMKK